MIQLRKSSSIFAGAPEGTTAHFLDDVHWMHINRLVLAINSIDEDVELRTTVLKELRFLIPYESAAFFLSDLSKDLAMSSSEWRSNPRFVEPAPVTASPV